MPTTNTVRDLRLCLLRTAGGVALAGLGAITILAGADRAGHSLSGWAPLSLSDNRANVAALIAVGDARAVQPAETFVRVAPMRRGALSRYALAAGSPDAMRAAAMTGWRDPLAQAWAVGQALSTGQAEIAAKRMESLLRAEPDGDLTAAMLFAVTADASARATLAMAMGMAGGGTWADAVVALPMDAGSLSLIAEARRAGFRADRTSAVRAVDKLNAQDPRAALVLHVALWGKGALGRAGLWSDRFEGIDAGSASPFAWRRQSDSTARLERSHVDGSIRLIVGNVGAVPQFVASTGVVVPAGDYDLSWRAGPDHDHANLTVEVACVGGGGPVLGPIVKSGDRYNRTVSVRPDCDAMRLRIFAPAASDADRWISAPAFRPALR